MAYNFSSFDKRASEVGEWLRKEFATIRTGRATPAILDGVRVSSYGVEVPLGQVGSIGIEDPRTLRISVWDAGQVQAVERAITDAQLGLSVVTDEKGVRVIFPELTGERREELLKYAKGKLEEARVSLRSARDEAVRQIEKEEMGEDEKFNAKEDLQKRVDASNKEFSELFEKKETEIRQ